MGAIANSKAVLTTAVPNGGTVTINSYPPGTSQALLAGTEGGRLVVNDNDAYPQAASGAGTVAFAFNASTIVITNNSGFTWPEQSTLLVSYGRSENAGSYVPRPRVRGLVTAPTGGSTVDAESRTALGQIIDVLRRAGLVG